MTIALPDLLLYCGALVILFLTPGPVWLAIMARGLAARPWGGDRRYALAAGGGAWHQLDPVGV